MGETQIYHAGMRELQDARDTRRIADRLAEVTLRHQFSDEDRAFIAACRFFFLATADGAGNPDCSYKGGAPGFVHVVGGTTLEIPDYDGNGMYRSWGNVLVNAQVALLFIDFDDPKRLRVQGRARIVRDPDRAAAHPGAVHIIEVQAENIFPNCPRYIHRMQLVEESAYTPRPGKTPPIPAWKTYDVFRDALPQRDRTP
jgi:predicted pyridoxine 5'-phosphate oxidase superfamily flavin-nucleotide-binding protein